MASKLLTIIIMPRLCFILFFVLIFFFNYAVLAVINCQDLFRPSVKPIRNSHLSNDVFAPFKSGFDPIFMKVLGDAQSADLSFQTIEYDAPKGYEITDNGFLPSVSNLGLSHRVLTQDGNQVRIDRDPSVEFLDEVRSLVVKAALDKYEGVIPDHIIRAVKKAEDELPPAKSAIGIVRDRMGVILGTIRVYSGFTQNGKIILPSTQVLRELDRMNPEFEKKLLSLVYGSEAPADVSFGYPKRSLIEVGQLSINRDLSPEQHDAVRNLLFQWVEIRLNESQNQIGNLLEPLVIAHVAGRKHAVLYRRQFGIKDVIFSVPNRSNETQIDQAKEREDNELVLSIGVSHAIANSAKTRQRKN